MKVLAHALMMIAGVAVGIGATVAASAAVPDAGALPAPGPSVVREVRVVEGRETVRPEGSPSLDAEGVAAIVRAELERERATRGTAPEEPAPWTPEHEADAVASFDLLSERVDAARAVGLWTDADREAALEHIGRLDAARRIELEERLILAINEGEIAVVSNGAPWW
jgi:hypothetical protein